MNHGAANKICRMLVALPLAGLWILDGSWVSPFSTQETEEQEIGFALPILSAPMKAAAQQIVPQPNSTETIVTPVAPSQSGETANQLDITGGKRSQDGSNLFHSFSEFNVEKNQIINFISNPSITNILNRVTGGDPSLINGIIQVSDGNSNLFIMNPAGIIFGANARLDVPGSFVATTASGIGFNFGTFNAIGEVDYEMLSGAPTSFSFPTLQPGAIANTGELAVAQGEKLILLGGAVINTGEISAPGGQIAIASVPGENVVRISQTGHLLNLEIATRESAQIDGRSSTETEIFNPLSLPELLTSGREIIETATGITVEGDRVILTASQQQISDAPGTTIISGSIDVSSVENSASAKGAISIFGDTVGLFDASIDASGTYFAGTVRIGGNYRGAGVVPNATRTYVDNNTEIQVDSFFGEGGRVVIWSDEVTVFFGSIDANGNTAPNLNLENLTINNLEEFSSFVQVGSQGSLVFDGTVTTRAADGSLGNLLLNSANMTVTSSEISVARPGETSPGAIADAEGQERDSNILFGDVTTESKISETALENLTETTNVILDATANIIIDDLPDDRLELNNDLGGKIRLRADIDMDGDGSFLMTSGDTISTGGEAIAISGASITAGNIETDGGNIELRSSQGSITANNLSSATSNSGESGGNMTINAPGEISTGELNSRGDFQGGEISLYSQTASIETAGNIDSSSTNGRGGDITMEGAGAIETGNINARGRSNGGNVNLTGQETVTTLGILTSSNSGENGKITMTGNEINLLGEEDSISSNGNLILQPYSPNQNINIGSTENAESLNLTPAELATLADGFSSITIGRSNSGGTITISPAEGTENRAIFNDRVTIQVPAGSGSIVGGGSITGVGDASITLNANSDVSVGNITSVAGINITSKEGNITAANLSATEDGGAIAAGVAEPGISMEANGDITARDITSTTGASLASSLGNITTGNVSANAIQGSGGNIRITSSRGMVGTGNLNAVGAGGGGNIEIEAGDRITTGRIDTSSTLGSGGATTLRAGNDIEAVSIATEGGAAGSGGNLRVSTGGFFRVTGTFTDQNQIDASISTAGGIGGGAIAIQHGGGDCTDAVACSSTAFTVGDSTTNGTAGAITDGQYTIAPTQTVSNNFDIREVGKLIGEDSDSSETETDSETESESESEEESTESPTPETEEESTESPTPETEEETAESPTPEPPEPSAESPTPETQQETGESPTPETQQETAESPTPPSPSQSPTPPSPSQSPTPTPPSQSPTPPPNQSPTQETERENAAANNNAPVVPLQPDTDRGVLEEAQRTPAIAPNPSPPTVPVENPSPPTAPVENPSLPTAPVENPEPIAEALEDPSLPPVLENPVGTTLALNNPDLTSPVLDNNPTAPVLDNLEPTAPVADNPNSTAPIPDNNEASAVEPNLLSSTVLDNSDPNVVSASNLTQPILSENNIVIPTPEVVPINNFINNYTNLTDTVSQLEQIRGREFARYLGDNVTYTDATAANIRETLSSVAKIGIKPGIIYVSARDNYLELQLFLPNGKPIVRSSGNKRLEVLEVAKEFSNRIRTPSRLDTQDYLPSARQLYDWFIAPLSEELEANGINMLIFSMDAGLRTIPLAALHDGQEFLVEKYSIGLIPSFSLTDTRYVSLEGAHVLAMGASEFPSDPHQSPLPAVEAELKSIRDRWPGRQPFLNQEFTLENLKEQRNKEQYRIIHLATHGEFHPGGAKNSYIQFWDTKLEIDRLRELRLYSPQVELLVLSACTTAVGDEEAELGFAGLAVQAGVKSALASLWYVSDTGTLTLMSEFYRQLFERPIKAEALRQAQLAMLKGKLELRDGYLYRGNNQQVRLPSELTGRGKRDLSHPYYWAAFTMIGSPW